MVTATLNGEPDTSTAWELVDRLSREQKRAAALLNRDQGRFLVAHYYELQHYRISSAHRMRTAGIKPHDIMQWLTKNLQNLEKDLQGALGHWARRWRVGLWLQSICGIGPVISAGLLAHLDIRHAKTAGHFWSFAGLSTHQEWKKGEKRPWNADLKTLAAFKLGESFVKVQNNKNDFYGKLFKERKLRELEANDRSAFKDQAAAKLERFKIGKTTEAYKYYSAGLLPPAHIHARARRWAVKLFLSHLHEVMFTDYYGFAPAEPYVMSTNFADGTADHRHRIDPPNWPIQEGRPLAELLEQEEEATVAETHLEGA